MRRVIFGVALIGVAAVAIVARSQLTKSEGERASASEKVSAVESVGASVSGDTGVSAPAPASTSAPSRTPTTSLATTPTHPISPAEKPYNPDLPITVDDPQTGATVLKKAAAAYARVTTLKANFTQKRENPLLGSTNNSRGTLYQKRPDRFLMKFSQPAGDIILSDGRYFWVYYPSADRKQVIRAAATRGAAGGVDLQAQFLGDPLTRFTHTYHGLENGLHVLTMVPRTNMGYKSLKVWIDAKDSLVRRFILVENNGVVVEIGLSGLVVNQPLSNDLFRFTPPADARIIENL